jgi:hypothetical protein
LDFLPPAPDFFFFLMTNGIGVNQSTILLQTSRDR